MAAALQAHREMEVTEEETDISYRDIEDLTASGINAADIARLKLAGCATVGSILMTTKKQLACIKGLSEAKIEKIVEAANRLMATEFITAKEYDFKRKSIHRISTGSREVDIILGGGIQSMAITEAFGEFRTGKTQLAHTLCITTQLPRSMGGAEGKVVYVDTEGNFRPERLKAIAGRYGIDPVAALENVIFTRAYNSEKQFQLLEMLAARFVEEEGAYKLLIIDSIMALFRVDYSGRGELADRQQKLGQMLSKLTKLADEFNMAIFITNQMTADPAGGLTFVADPKKPIGGHVLAHASTTRLYLRKGRAENRIVKIYDSPDCPESEATFAISEGGIIDAKE